VCISFYFKTTPPPPQNQESKIAINFAPPPQEIIEPEEIIEIEPIIKEEPKKEVIPEEKQPEKIIEKPKIKKEVIKKPIKKKEPNPKKKIIKKPKKQPKKIPKKEVFNEKKIETLNLLAREKFNVLSQIKNCHKRAIAQMKVANHKNVTINIKIQKNGYINPKSIVVKDFIKYSNPKEVEFKNSVDIAKKALEICNPLRNLPLDKYNIWKEVTLQFKESLKN
jgi:hypothetical protein